MSKLTSFEDQVLLPVIEEIINGEVKRQDDKRETVKVADEYAKTKSGSKILKGKLSSYLSSPEGRLTITQPVMELASRIEIIGDPPRVNKKKLLQQQEALKKEIFKQAVLREPNPIIAAISRVFIRKDTPPPLEDDPERAPRRPRGSQDYPAIYHKYSR